jgi:hypothetical protein
MRLAASRGLSVVTRTGRLRTAPALEAHGIRSLDLARGGALDELRNLLDQLGLGVASDSIYHMIMDLDTSSMSLPQLERATRGILALHGREACADAVIAALAEVNFFEPAAARRA